jgi:DNA invertase Pin-like site-specific DNA recombinase
MSTYVAYYRVSTDRQGASGLGLDAQREAVARFAGAGNLLAEYTEVESGKKHTNRPQLAAALAASKKQGATLVIAKLDRLARNVHFISGLMESKVDFVAVDMPQANRLTVHIMAAFAEHEREMISQRTKAALAQAKARGTKLGNPRLAEARENAAAQNREVVPDSTVEFIRKMRGQGESLRAIAEQLNQLHVTTPRGSAWYANTVRAVLLQKPARLLQSQLDAKRRARRMTPGVFRPIRAREGQVRVLAAITHLLRTKQ